MTANNDRCTHHHHHHRLSTPRIRPARIGSPIRNSKLVLISGASRPTSGLRLREAKKQRIGSSCDVKQHVFLHGRVPWALLSMGVASIQRYACSPRAPTFQSALCLPANSLQDGGTLLDKGWRTLSGDFSSLFQIHPLDLEKNICRCSTEKCIFKDARSDSGTGRYRLGLRNIGLRNRAEKSSSPLRPLRPLRHCACCLLPGTTALAKVKECNWDS